MFGYNIKDDLTYAQKVQHYEDFKAKRAAEGNPVKQAPYIPAFGAGEGKTKLTKSGKQPSSNFNSSDALVNL